MKPPLLDGPAEVVMADTAYDADHLRQAIAAKGPRRIPNIPSRAQISLDKHSMPSAISWNAASQKLKQFRRVVSIRRSIGGVVGETCAALSAVGYNFRRILAWLRDLLRLFLIAIVQAFCFRSALNPAS